RLWRRLIVGALVLALAGASGGCSFQLDSLKSTSEVEHTGSARPTVPRQAASLPPENDLGVARTAVSELMSHGGKDTSGPWENARGTITSIASAYSQDGLTCQDFLASYVREGSESWMQGEACRQHQGRWEVRNLRPWQRT